MPSSNTRPNILFIQSDQHRYDCLGHSQDYPVHTPNLDRLAQDGAWFSNSYTPIPLCCPARQALLHGKRPEAFGALWNYDLSLPTGVLPPTAYSWPRELQSDGYRTAYFGKWHVHPQYGPEAYGFGHVVTDEDHARHVQRLHGNITYQNGYFGEPEQLPLADTHTHYMTAQCIEWLKQLQAGNGDQISQPWHVRLDFHAPHLPCRPAEPFASMYKAEDVPQWRSFSDTLEGKPYIQQQQLVNWRVEQLVWEDWAPTVALYYGYISQVDDAVGNVLRALQELGLEENTIVIYTSDHGDMCGGHRMMDKHYVMYEDVVKIPLIIRWPGRVQPGTTIGQWTYNLLDLQPTLLEAVGQEVPGFFHGRSLMRLLQGESVSDWREEIISTYNGQQFGLYVQRMLRTLGWKYIWNPTDVDELYDLEADPEELVNCIHDPAHTVRIAGFRKRLYEELTKLGDGAVNGEWMRDQLLSSRKL